MNKYALMAAEHWARYAPARYAALEDPTTFFTDLGESAAAQIQELAIALERGLPTEIPYLERVAQLRAVQKQAEATVLADLVYSVEPEHASLTEELATVLDSLPSATMIAEDLAAIIVQAEEEAERDGSSRVILTDEQKERQQRLEQLLALVSSPAPTEDRELMMRIVALREFLPAE